MAERVYVALGSNLGDRAGYLRFALEEIGRLPGTRILNATEPEETAPFGPPGQNAYLNQMIVIETALEPHDLLAQLLDIERRAGRERRIRWGARTLDLDIVAFGERRLADDQLVLPHPGLEDRDFWRREFVALGGTLA